MNELKINNIQKCYEDNIDNNQVYKVVFELPDNVQYEMA